MFVRERTKHKVVQDVEVGEDVKVAAITSTSSTSSTASTT
jgi:hypothetical protein